MQTNAVGERQSEETGDSLRQPLNHSLEFNLGNYYIKKQLLLFHSIIMIDRTVEKDVFLPA